MARLLEGHWLPVPELIGLYKLEISITSQSYTFGYQSGEIAPPIGSLVQERMAITFQVFLRASAPTNRKEGTLRTRR